MSPDGSKKRIAPQIGVLTMKVMRQADCIVAVGRCTLKLIGSKESLDTEKLSVVIPDAPDSAYLSFAERYGRKLPGGFRLNSFRLEIGIEQAKKMDVQNRVIPVYDGEHEGRFLYTFRDLKKGHNRNSEIIIDDDLAMYFRQTKYNTLKFTVRDVNIYDSPEGQERLRKAQRKAKKLSGDDIILMYEKNCSRYEESASVLYERLIDAGYDNVYYVVDTSIPVVQELDAKYKANLIEKDSDKHLEYFFASKKFISSETIDHALQLRVANKAVQDKINGKGLSYVFLQHGVMYMVSLDSKLRTGFRKKGGYKIHRTVVSSEAEARHFIELAEMSRKDLYITGLAKFDTSYQNEGADKIIIMPTWRRWETNEAAEDIEQTGYFKMLVRMFEAVPDNLKDKIVILPHPLIAERFKGDHALGKSLLLADSYDKVLRDCKLLITDYSSIAYDAFYRGANVVFDWQDLDECMEHYGEDAHLMLNDDNAFGAVCRSGDELARAVENLYDSPQSEQNLTRYRKIVEFSDGKNSERIIERLIKDKIIKAKEEVSNDEEQS